MSKPYHDMTAILERLDQATAWACPDCGAFILDSLGDWENRASHERWHQSGESS